MKSRNLRRKNPILILGSEKKKSGFLEWKIETWVLRRKKIRFWLDFSNSWSKELEKSDFLEWKVEIWEDEIRFWLNSWSGKLNLGSEKKKTDVLEWKIEIWALRRKKSDFDLTFRFLRVKKAQNINNERRTKKNQISWSEKSKFEKMKSDFDFGFWEEKIRFFFGVKNRNLRRRNPILTWLLKWKVEFGFWEEKIRFLGVRKVRSKSTFSD